MAVTNDTILARLDTIHAEVGRQSKDINEVKELQKVANGRISKIELARAEERGARQAVAAAAANTAAALALKDKSTAWKIGWTSAAIAAFGVVGTIAGVVAQLIVH